MSAPVDWDEIRKFNAKLLAKHFGSGAQPPRGPSQSSVTQPPSDPEADLDEFLRKHVRDPSPSSSASSSCEIDFKANEWVLNRYWIQEIPLEIFKQPRRYPDPPGTPQVLCFLKRCHPDHLASQCRFFIEMGPHLRGYNIKKTGRCWCCWLPLHNPSNPKSHNSSNCPHPRFCKCGSDTHHTLLHGAKFATMKKSGK
jgi:hypothetical protein